MNNTEVFDYSHEALIKRGKYLTEVIDKIPNKATRNDIEELPAERGGRYVVTWSPSSGKTTAIRQFIVKHVTDGLTGVVATKLIKDANSLYYDIIAQSYYLESINNNNVRLSSYLNALKIMVIPFTSSNKEVTIESLKSSAWIICTHERLFIEPSSILFTRDISRITMLPTDSDVLLRKYLFIDEYPSSLYKTFNTEQVYMLSDLATRAGVNKETNSFNRSILVSRYIDKVYHEYDKTRQKSIDTALVNNLPTPTNQSMITDVSRGMMSTPSQFSRERVKFFASTLINKYDQLESSNNPSKDYITYSVSDLPAVATYIFDGTGDLLMRDSSLWKIINNPKFKRNLSLIDDKVTLVNNIATRKMSNEHIFNEYVKIINRVLKSVNNEKLLVYLWKGSKKLSDNRDNELISSLSEYYKDQVSLISYQSGLERVTSNYSSINNVLILGKFFIPTEVINLLNELNQSRITTYEYTMSLLIQLIYRTSARHNKPIRLFIDKTYGTLFINSLLDKFNIINRSRINFYDLNPEVLALSNSKLLKRNKLIDTLSSTDKYRTEELNTFLINNDELANILGVSYVKNSRLKHILDSLLIDYEVTEGISKGTGHGIKSVFKIIT